jgi:hypothetical protein
VHKVPGSILLLVLCSVLFPAEAGHEMPYYPSYYPQEIRIETMPPETAVTRLQSNTLHAFIGGALPFGEMMPANVRVVETLGAYLVVTLNSAAPQWSHAEARCTLVQQMLDTLGAADGTYIFHPYPVTPYHWDYLHHVDRVEIARTHVLQHSQPSVNQALHIRARGKLAEGLVQSRWPGEGEGWDALLEEIALDDLLAPHTTSLNGWLGPPWMKEGWFHAYLLLAPTLSEQAVRERVAAAYERLVQEHTGELASHLNAERDLVALLLSGCERAIVGYTARRDYFNTDFSAGIENLAYDAHTGFNSAIFLRTVKLKDFPWNGWLRLGVPTTPSAAWNPVGGFTDVTGRLIWYAVGDPALFPAPYSGSWTLNRIGEYQSTIGSLGPAAPVQGMDKP